MKKTEAAVIIFILVVAFATRLYKIGRPIADWHSWRQADTAAVARNFIKEGYNPLIPKYDDMSSQTNGLDNPNRYRFVEFPIQASLIALVWKFTGPVVAAARLVTVIVSIGSTLLLFLLVKKFSRFEIAALAAFFFATIPYNVFYSSTILPAPFMVFFLLALYLCFINWMSMEKLKWGIASVIFANLAILTWPIALFFMLPPIFLAWEKYKSQTVKRKDLWIFTAGLLLPFLVWRLWMMKFPSGIPNFMFLINEGNIRFKGAFFRWIIAERLGKLILTVGGFPLFLLGLIKNPGKEKYFYAAFLLSAILYVIVFASGNVRHDYYQVPLMPPITIFMAIGVYTLFTIAKPFNKYAGSAVAVFLIVLIYAFGYYEIRGYYWINRPQIVEAGKAVDRLLPKDAAVIAPYNGDTAFLYQTNRHGYPIVDRPLTELVKSNTKYLVSVDLDNDGIKSLTKNCKVLEKTQDYVILELESACLTK